MGKLLFVYVGSSILICSYWLFPRMVGKVAGKLDQGVTLMMYLGSAWIIAPSGRLPSNFFLWVTSVFLGKHLISRSNYVTNTFIHVLYCSLIIDSSTVCCAAGAIAIHSFHSLSYDRSITSSKASST